MQSKDPYLNMTSSQERTYFVYVMGGISGTLYIGSTSNLRNRVWQHKNHVFPGLTSGYAVDRLLYFESYVHASRVITREKQLKSWRREKKVALIKKDNPKWEDLSREWYNASEMTIRAVPDSTRK